MKKPVLDPGRLLIPVLLIAAGAPLLAAAAAEPGKGFQEYPLLPLLVVLPVLAALAAKFEPEGARHPASGPIKFFWIFIIPAAAVPLFFSRFIEYPFVNLATGHLYNADTWAAVARARELAAAPSLDHLLESVGYRWIPASIMAACYHIGGLSPVPYQLVELILFAASAGLLADIASRLAGSRRVGIITGLVFVLVPAHAVTIHWLLGIDYLAAGFFFLLSWHMYTLFVFKGGRLALTISMFSSAVAYLCHEITFILPAFLACTHMFHHGKRWSPISLGLFLVPWLFAFFIYQNTGVQLKDRGAVDFSLPSLVEAYFFSLPSNLAAPQVHSGRFFGMSPALPALLLPALFISAWVPTLLAGGAGLRFFLICFALVFFAFLPVHNIVLVPGLKEMKHFYFVSMPVALLTGGILGVSSGRASVRLLRRVITVFLIGFLVLISRHSVAEFGKTAELYDTAEREFEKILRLPEGSVVMFLFEENDISGISYLFDDWLLGRSGTLSRTRCKEVRRGRRIHFRDGETAEAVFDFDNFASSENNYYFIVNPVTCVIREVTGLVRDFQNDRAAFAAFRPGIEDEPVTSSATSRDTLEITAFADWTPGRPASKPAEEKPLLFSTSRRLPSLTSPPLDLPPLSRLDRIEIFTTLSLPGPGSAAGVPRGTPPILRTRWSPAGAGNTLEPGTRTIPIDPGAGNTLEPDTRTIPIDPGAGTNTGITSPTNPAPFTAPSILMEPSTIKHLEDPPGYLYTIRITENARVCLLQEGHLTISIEVEEPGDSDIRLSKITFYLLAAN